ncbi:ATP-binding cassette domain-containing protein [Fuchsiella alkaliacetigena]|uniref:ATP-binding cassette domain-containing protein n=1 Tax=Fuchsiella alkaliacetigena TaxID=957042 RepID=UPI00200B89F5|nr:ABC transporter ATP-binding protein [Fuchsiella alkaliacetigena]MCK8825890.1 ABC transporter ATP-binding protein [Fuchsiella alkaliacetigena]
MAAAIISGENIVKYYGEEKILDIEEVVIEEGLVLALMGPNGSGKSTLIKILSQLEECKQSKIYFQGELVTAKNRLAVRRKIGFIWQDPLLYNTSVYENIALSLKFRDLSEEKINTKVGEALTRLNINKLANKNAKQLSGGEKQKVSIARTLVAEPELIFIDEPNTSLDIDSINLVEEIIAEEVEKGVSVLVVTHNFYQAKSLADEVLVLKEGRLVDQDRPENLSIKEEGLLKYI